MNCISIGKPAINEYIALQEFPKQGDIFSNSEFFGFMVYYWGKI